MTSALRGGLVIFLDLQMFLIWRYLHVILDLQFSYSVNYFCSKQLFVHTCKVEVRVLTPQYVKLLLYSFTCLFHHRSGPGNDIVGTPVSLLVR